MDETPQTKRREQGSTLILVLGLTVLFAALSAALLFSSITVHRTTEERRDHEFAYRVAESAVAYFFAEYSVDVNYFTNAATPSGTFTFDNGSFLLEDAIPGAEPGSWNILVRANVGDVSFLLGAAIGYAQLAYPAGLTITGTGDPTDDIFTLMGNSTVGSYDSTVAAFDITAPGGESTVLADGSLSLVGQSTVFGGMQSTGTVTTAGAAAVVGSVLEHTGLDVDPDDLSVIGKEVLSRSLTSNNNAALSGIFGAGYSALAGPEAYGDLSVNAGDYVVPAGTYRFRRFSVGSGATVTFDTSGGPIEIVFIGSGGDGHPQRSLTVSGGSVVIDSGGTTHGLMTVLGAEADMAVISGGLFGQTVNDPDSAGYSQIISVGADGTADDIAVTGSSTVYGRLFAAGSTLDLGGNSSWYGAAVVREIGLSGNSGPSYFAVDLDSLGRMFTLDDRFEIYGMWHAGFEQGDAN